MGRSETAIYIGRYEIVRRIATGGMAELFLARASSIHGFEKLVVLKRILPQHAENEDFIQMFLSEARLAATLHHPNVAQVYDIGEVAGQYFFTMEYVQGQDLRKLVRAARKQQQPIPLEHILHVLMGAAGGLHHAHEKVDLDGKPLGIVHRDVSPSNVIVTYEGDVKVVDFGIAKAATAQVATIAGTLKGKIPYMSPEQCRGEAVDRRSDVFSLGTLLWELTTGRRLFAGDNEFAILNRVAKGDVPPPSSIRPEYPPGLEAIVMRALKADPRDRFATALDFRIELEDFARDARLPVSSARVGAFMQALFAEEIRAPAIESPSRADWPIQVVAASSTSIGLAAGSSEEDPSEVRGLQGQTPSAVLPSGTSYSISQRVSAIARVGTAMAAGAGIVLTLFGSGALYAYLRGAPQAREHEDPTPNPTVTFVAVPVPGPAVKVPVDAPPPVAVVPLKKREPKPKDTTSTSTTSEARAEPAKTPEAAPAKPASSESAPAAAKPESSSAPIPAVAKPPATTKSGTTTRPRTTTRKSTKPEPRDAPPQPAAESPKPPPKTIPKRYDPDDPLPPGG